MSQTENIPLTNYTLIEAEYSDILFDTIDKGVSGITVRKQFKFNNDYTLNITEHIKNKSIDKYFYDLEDENGNTVFKFHSEKHDRDIRYQTKSEPFHIHMPDGMRLTTMDRGDNWHHRRLDQIMELIRILFWYKDILLNRFK